MKAKKKVKGKVKEMTAKEKNKLSYGIRIRLIRKKKDYIIGLFKGGYYLARCNMMVEQLNKGKILETIDGCPKTKELMKNEFMLMKLHAIDNLRNAHFAGRDLIKDFKLTKEDIVAIEKDYYEGKIMRKEYDESCKKGRKAEFVKTPSKH